MAKKRTKSKRDLSAEHIARIADSGRSVAAFFTNNGRMIHPISHANDRDRNFRAPKSELPPSSQL